VTHDTEHDLALIILLSARSQHNYRIEDVREPSNLDSVSGKFVHQCCSDRLELTYPYTGMRELARLRNQ
jgi:hypothetical protein